MLTILTLARKLSDSARSASEVGRAHEQGNEALAWFDPKLFTVSVRFSRRDSGDAQKLLVSLVTNGFHGFIGPFEIDGEAYVTDDRVIIPLVRDEAREPMPVLVGAVSA